MVKFSRHYLSGLPRLGEIMAPEANSFGVLRVAMASLVLISHSYLYAFGTPHAEPLTAWTGHSLGEHAVQVFFILSGILVAQSFDRSRSLVDFAAARILRIFPALIVCVLLTTLVLGPLMSTLPLISYFAGGELPTYLFKTLSLSTGNAPLPGVFRDLPLAGAVNTSLWTLKYEVLCYAGLAIAGTIGLFKPQWRGHASLTLAAFLLGIFSAEPKDPETYAFVDNVRYFALFFGTGVLAYLIRDKIVISGAFLLPLAALFVVGLGTRFGEFSTAMLLGYAVVWATSKTFGPMRSMCNRVDLSFGVYIYAGPIQQALIDTSPAMHPLLIALVAAMVVLPLALLSWVVIEQPALGLRRVLHTRRDTFALRRRRAAQFAT